MIALLAMFAGLLLTATLSGDDDPAEDAPVANDTADMPPVDMAEDPLLGDEKDAPQDPLVEDDAPEDPLAEEDDAPDDPLVEDDTPKDLGATATLEADGSITLDLGEDETGSLAVIYYMDTEDASKFVVTDEARFYLVPEDVDWSDSTTETRIDIPGATEHAGGPQGYYLQDFEATFGLELLATVDLLEDDAFYGQSANPGQPSWHPFDRGLQVNANAPLAAYSLQANTDGDELVDFLPEDQFGLRRGVSETVITQSTTGTDDVEWLSTSQDGVTLDGAGGGDILEATANDTTLIGGAGDDRIEAFDLSYGVPSVGTAAFGGSGDDYISIGVGVVDGGEGDDRIRSDGGQVIGGDGDDRIRSSGDATVFGGNGNDTVNSSGGISAQAFGEAGDDVVNIAGENGIGRGGLGDDSLRVGTGATGFGDSGNDTLGAWAGARAIGGDGDDLLTTAASYDFAFITETATLTGGDGADTFGAQIWNAKGGEADSTLFTITDFDPAEDVLRVGGYDANSVPQSVEIVEAPDGAYTDVRVTMVARDVNDPGIIVMRLEGITGFSAEQVVLIT